MKKIIPILLLVILLSGCSVVRIDTSNIDNIVNIVLSKNNKLHNQIGQGYKYYLPGGVTYISSDELNDILYCNGKYYYLYMDAINYFYKTNTNYIENSEIYYSKKFDQNNGFDYSGYLEIKKQGDLYNIEFFYNYAKIEAIVEEKDINNTVLNSAYILSTIKFNYNIVELMLNEDYFVNKTGKFENYDTNENNNKFELQKENTMEES